jgi:hypothetical protein
LRDDKAALPLSNLATVQAVRVPPWVFDGRIRSALQTVSRFLYGFPKTYRLSGAEMVHLYTAGEDTLTIGIKAGCSSTTVAKILRTLGVTIRKPGYGRPARNYRTD